MTASMATARSSAAGAAIGSTMVAGESGLLQGSGLIKAWSCHRSLCSNQGIVEKFPVKVYAHNQLIRQERDLC
jgi:hypothetical protein